ncbi:Hsp33 family molecular chaperone HslO [Formicincola oecophyllae]|uniref:Hsp33 family molecular chaperone HslO n=1 Tax=Formicincola oecophyllae TaxID=2558361 RepID=A0A4Y6U7N9_9PROT|nr:Hsp33 family molecular chaperone HslO [Formicincola oecophyllae]QDH13433.1 Hsp33 family molecular chaperone HslO [Formicincola oecophyllae]
MAHHDPACSTHHHGAHADETIDLTVADGVLPFHLAAAPARGRVVRLGPLAQAILGRHNLPAPVLGLGAEALALVAGMASTLKFAGSFSLQVKGDGPVSLLVADCTSEGGMRFTARMDEAWQANPTPLSDKANELLGKGYLAFTIDQGPDTERHQGIVELKGESLAAMAEGYFSSSEQHPCCIQLYQCHDEGHGWQGAGLFMERTPLEAHQAAPGTTTPTDALSSDELQARAQDGWETAVTFARSLKQGEMFDDALSSSQILHRLFGTLGVADGQPRPLSFACRCSRERLKLMLERFEAQELDEMADNGVITMDCGFCNTKYRFDRNTVTGTANKASQDAPNPVDKKTH